ncbi:acyl-CoA N-acyltransferase [Gongronella butleri]|nr:acyl-CoA N-acyltransferase [Gongronella butleri]
MICELNDGEDFVYLDHIHALPRAQGRGIGKLLLQQVYEWARTKGLEKATLHVIAENARAIGFYESQGWTSQGPFDGPTIRGQVVKALAYSRTIPPA